MGVRYQRNPHPTGGVPGVVRNLGWPQAQGRFVHFLDDDDIVPAGYYAAVGAAFAARPDIGLVFGRIEPFGSGPEPNCSTSGAISRARRASLPCAHGSARKSLLPARCCSICRCSCAARAWCGATAWPASAASIQPSG